MLRPILELGEVFSQPLGDRAAKPTDERLGELLFEGLSAGCLLGAGLVPAVAFHAKLCDGGDSTGFDRRRDEPWYSFFQRQGLLELNRSH